MKSIDPMKVILLFLLFYIPFFCSFGQIITGKVIDKNQEPMEFASVMLLNKTDSSLVNFVTSKASGEFELKDFKSGNYLVQITYLGYESYWQSIEVSNEPILLGIISLKLSTKELKSLVVSDYGSPMEFGKDTVTYNASAFKSKVGDVVEDLLKKLPGIEVERDGSIKAFGENVKNVLVDGKEFFGKDIKIATKNLDANAIDKVQVFDRKSDMAEFTGIEDGQDERTINLKLKPGKKAGYFGTGEIAGGNDERFNGRINLNRFTPQSKISFIGMANNINEQNFSMNDYFSFMGGLSSMMSGGGINMGESGGIPLGMANTLGVQKSFAGGLNYSKDLNKNTSLTSSVFFNNFQNNLLNSASRENFIKDGVFFSEINDDRISVNNATSFNVRLKSKISPFQNIIFRVSGGFGNNNLESTNSNTSFNGQKVKINENSGTYSVWGSNYNFTPTLTYQRKLGKAGRSIVLNGKTNINNSENDADLDSKNTFFRSPILVSKILQSQLSANEGIGFDFNGVYIEPIGKKKFVEFNAGLNDQNSRSNTDFYDIINQNLIQNFDLSRWFERDYVNRRTGIKYSTTQSKYSLAFGLNFENSLLKGLINNEYTQIKNKFKAVLPVLFYNYDIGTGHNFGVNYTTDMVEPTLQQLQPIINNSNPLNVYQGNPNLKNEYRHSLVGRYMKYNSFEFRMFYANLRIGYIQNKINNKLTIDPSLVRTFSPENSRNEQNGSGRLEYSTPIKPLKIKTKIALNSNFSNGFSLVNNVWNRTTIFGKGFNLSLENRKKDKIDIVSGLRYYRSDSKFSQNPNLAQNYTESTIYLEGSFNIGANMVLKTNFDQMSFKQSFSEEVINVPLWKASLTTFVNKNKKLMVTANVFDILNLNKGVNRTSNLNYNEISQTNVLGRYFLIGLSYNIKGFKKTDGLEIKMEN